MYMKWGPENKHTSVSLVLEMKKFHYLLILAGESFLSTDHQQESLIFLWYIGYLWSMADLHFWKLRSYPQKQDQPRKQQWASLRMPVTMSLARAPKLAALGIRGLFSHRQCWGHFVWSSLVCREMGCDHFILAAERAYVCCGQLELARSKAKFF